MNAEGIQKLKEKYNKIQKEQEKIKRCQKRIKELEEHPIIKEYNNILKILANNKVIKEEEIIWEALEGIHDNEENIFVYLHSEEELPYDWNSYKFRDYHDSRVTHRIYKSIETGAKKVLPIDKCEQFEKENIVLYSASIDDDELNDEYAAKITEIFFRELVKSDVVKATEKIKSLNRK